MIKRIILFVAGLVVFGWGCTMIFNIRGWLLPWLGTGGAGWTCFWIKCAIAMTANYLTMLIFLRALYSSANEFEDINSNQTLVAENSGHEENVKIYRHPRIKVYMHFAISVAFSMGLFLLTDPKKQAIILCYVTGFLFSMFFLTWAIYTNIFYIKINSCKILIRGFWVEELLIANIAKVNFSSAKGFRIILITLDGGKVCSIGGTLKNHRELVDILKSCALKNGGRWFFG